jgi:NADH-quinone oxidoreductase subunit M
MQMVNHGLVVVPLFLIVGVIAARAGGSESLGRLGGVAMRAPVLASLFLIVAFATLAMPGSPNFVGEILILFGAFENKLVFGLVATMGVALAAVYMIRAFQQSMHNDVGPGVEVREANRVDLAALAPLVAVVIALGVYPQIVLDRTEPATQAQIQPAQEAR